MPLISVIIPVYNLEKVVSKCVDSIIGQTILDIEIIIVNDGSIDGTGAILKQKMKEDARIRVITQENAGPGAAYNRGLKEASGQYIYIIDGDNFIDDDTLACLYAEIKQSAAQIVCCEYYIDRFAHGHYEKIGELRFQEIRCSSRQEIAQVFFALYRHQLLQSPCNKLYEREALAGMYFSEDRHEMLIVDTEFNLRMLQKIARLSCIHKKLVHYVQYDLEDRTQITSLWHTSYHFDAFECELKLCTQILRYQQMYLSEDRRMMQDCHDYFARRFLALFQTLFLEQRLNEAQRQKEFEKRVQQVFSIYCIDYIQYIPYKIAFWLLENRHVGLLRNIFRLLRYVKRDMPVLFKLMKKAEG